MIAKDETENKNTMLRMILGFVAAVPLLASCAGSVPEPRQALADTESAARSAREVGADSEPRARLHVKLASEEVADARKKIAKGDNERATYVLLRARADAELGLALAHERNALIDKQKAVEQAAVTLDSSRPGGTP